MIQIGLVIESQKNLKMKSIKEIAWGVTEEDYRADPAISYSTLSSFARESSKVIPHLGEKKDTESLRFGSLVDCLLTEPDTLDSRFFIADFPSVGDKVEAVCKRVYERTKARSLSIAPKKELLQAIVEEEYYPNWGEEAKLRNIIKSGTPFYSLLSLADGKTILSTDDFNRAKSCVEVLLTHPFTKDIFFSNPFSNTEKIYQLKFRTEELAEYPVRCMMDLCIVDHTNKIIRPIDLKTTGKDEEKFEDSFIQWMYMLQATLYAQILQLIISKDTYFKDFTILPYWFVVINKYNQTPLVWEFKHIFWEGDFVVKKSGERLKGWRSLLKEFLWHVNNKKYEYSYESYINNGVREIQSLDLYDKSN